jgi:hypothetical protein
VGALRLQQRILQQLLLLWWLCQTIAAAPLFLQILQCRDCSLRHLRWPPLLAISRGCTCLSPLLRTILLTRSSRVW